MIAKSQMAAAMTIYGENQEAKIVLAEAFL
jgi:hypothetical protein